jgi:serine/threonine protein kinase
VDASPRKARELFLAAIKLPAEEQEAYVQEACGDDQALHHRVSGLLHAQAEIGSFHQAPALTIDQPITESPGTVIGPYKLMEQIGEGGMGLVFVAEQQEPIRRKVALKIIKPGMDTRQVIARFEAERQALAMMEHAHIAKVHDGGTTPEGRPYFVMELVKGVPITEYCDQNQVPVRERLELFVDVCLAVQHAHQKGIIHRDIKPSNVLVTSHDGKPVVKVIDFGVAKAIGQQLTDKTVYTHFAQMIGTPLYMSPEQAGQSGLDVDTRSDIYSLGVLLYELLTGTTPFDKERLSQVGYDEMRRIIREEEPPKPSTRISTQGKAASTASANRKTDPRKLSHLFRGELDWIVMKALEKDRNRRYDTANGFAQDVQRYLADEPVQACPPSVGYRLKKMIRRNRGSVLAAALVVLALIGGVIGATVGMVQAETARGAEEKQREVAETERDQKEAARAQAVKSEAEAIRQKLAAERATEMALKRLRQIERANVILGSIFRKLDTRAAETGSKPLLAQLGEGVAEAVTLLDDESVGDPVVVAFLQRVLGQAQLHLGYPERAIDLLTRARKTAEAQPKPDDLEIMVCVDVLAQAYQAAGQRDKALPLFQANLEKAKGKFKPNHEIVLRFTNNLGSAYLADSRGDKAVPLYEDLLPKMQAAFGPDDPNTLRTMNNLASAYHAAHRLDKAIPLFEKSLALTRAKHGPDHPDTLTSMGTLAQGYQRARRFGEAVALFQDTLAGRQATLGLNHPDTLRSMNNLGLAYLDARQIDKALALLKETLARRRAKQGVNHPETLKTLNNLGGVYLEAGQFDKAEPIFQETLAKMKVKLGVDHDDTLTAMRNLALCYYRSNRNADAEPLWLDYVKYLRSGPKAQGWKLAVALNTLSECQMALRKYSEAEKHLRECLAIYRETQPDSLMRYDTESKLGGALTAQRKFKDAEPLALSAYKGLNAMADKLPPAFRRFELDALERLIKLYDAWDKVEEAAKWRRKLDEHKKAAKPGAQGAP